MKRIPFSYSTHAEVQEKAKTKADREGRTVSTVIHEFLLSYTKDEAPSNPVQSEDLASTSSITPSTDIETPVEGEPAPALFLQTTTPIPPAANENLPTASERKQNAVAAAPKTARPTQRQKGRAVVKKGKQPVASKKKR